MAEGNCSGGGCDGFAQILEGKSDSDRLCGGSDSLATQAPYAQPSHSGKAYYPAILNHTRCILVNCCVLQGDANRMSPLHQLG